MHEERLTQNNGKTFLQFTLRSSYGQLNRKGLCDDVLFFHSANILRSLYYVRYGVGFPGGASGKEPAYQCWRLEIWVDPWVRKIPWRRAWQPTSVFLPGEIPWTEMSGRL